MESPYGVPQNAVGDSGATPLGAAAASHTTDQASTLLLRSDINKTLNLFSRPYGLYFHRANEMAESFHFGGDSHEYKTINNHKTGENTNNERSSAS